MEKWRNLTRSLVLGQVGHLGEEAWEGHRTLSKEKEAFITKNVMVSLPKRVGILFLPSELPKIVFTSFVETTKGHVFNKQHFIQSSEHQQEASKKPKEKPAKAIKNKEPRGVKIDEL